MKFSRVIGKIDPSLIVKAEEKLSQIFLELATRYNNEHVGSSLGGDPLVFSLVYPTQHIATLNIPTAATNSKSYFWNPKFVLKQSKIGLRIICAHEAFHALYMHPQRRGSRNPKLWNIAVDYIVNGTVMDDFKARKKDPAEMFSKHLGKYMTLKQYAEMLKNPFAPPKGFEDVNANPSETADPTITLPAPDEDRELTTKEIEELEKREKLVKFYYADPDIEADMRRPEKIYDLLLALLPKCEKCGRIGIYKRPKKDDKKDKGKEKQQGKDQSDQNGDQGEQGEQGDKSDQHNHGGDQPCDCPDHSDQGQSQDQNGNGGSGSCDHNGHCDDCCDGVDVFGLGGTVDDHMDADETPEKMAKRISEAMDSARKMAGYIPAGLEEELGKLTAPKISWKDVIRARLQKARAGDGRNDYTKFRSRPLFAGLMTPKRKSYLANFGCLLDCSGSMSSEDIAYGLSQLQSLDDRSEGVIVPADSEIYFNKATKIRKCNAEELQKVKVVGRGGTVFSTFFSDYEKNIGKCDFLIIISDMHLIDTDVAEMRDPGCPVYWLCTSDNSSFNPPFGKLLRLRD